MVGMTVAFPLNGVGAETRAPARDAKAHAGVQVDEVPDRPPAGSKIAGPGPHPSLVRMAVARPLDDPSPLGGGAAIDAQTLVAVDADRVQVRSPVIADSHTPPLVGPACVGPLMDPCPVARGGVLHIHVHAGVEVVPCGRVRLVQQECPVADGVEPPLVFPLIAKTLPFFVVVRISPNLELIV